MASAWLAGLEFTHFAGEVLKIGRPCPILSFEFCLSAKHRKNVTTAVRGGKAVKPNRQNVFCGAERIVIEFYAGNAAGRMSMALNSIKFFKSTTSRQSIGVVDLIVLPLPIHYHVNRFLLFAFGMQQVKMPHLNKKNTPSFLIGCFFLFRL